MKKPVCLSFAAICVLSTWTLWLWVTSAPDSTKQVPRAVQSNKQDNQSPARQIVQPLQLSKQDKLSPVRLAAAYGKLPLSFEVNQGQTDATVKFFSRGAGYALFLTGDEAVLAMRESGVRSQKSGARGRKFETRNSKFGNRNSKLVFPAGCAPGWNRQSRFWNLRVQI